MVGRKVRKGGKKTQITVWRMRDMWLKGRESGREGMNCSRWEGGETTNRWKRKHKNRIKVRVMQKIDKLKNTYLSQTEKIGKNK